METKISRVLLSVIIGFMLIYAATLPSASAATTPPEDTDYVMVDDYWPMENTGPGELIYTSQPLAQWNYGHGPASGQEGYVLDPQGDMSWGSELDRKYAQFVNPIYGVWDLGAPFSQIIVSLSQDHGPYPAEALEYKIWGSNDFDASNPGAATWIAADLDTVYRKGWSNVGEEQFTTCNDDYVALWDWKPGPGAGDSYRFVKLQSIWASPYDEPEVDAVKGVVGAGPSAGEAEWQETIVERGMVFSYTSLAIGYDGKVHIAYGGEQLYYAVWDGYTWQRQEIESGGVGAYCSLALDSTGKPAISYYDATNADLKYARWNGVSWDIGTVDSGGDVGQYTSLAFDSAGNPAISYYDATNDDLRYAHWNGTSWDKETVDSEGWVGSYTSLAFDSAGNPAISYYDASSGDLKYAYWRCCQWYIETVDSGGDVGSYTSLAFGSAGNPAISYHDATNGELKYAQKRGGVWGIDRVDSEGWVGLYTCLAFDSAGNPAISYYDATNGDLKYAHLSGVSWGVETVDSSGDVGAYTSLVFDSTGNRAISYYDVTNDYLKYAYSGAGGFLGTRTAGTNNDAANYVHFCKFTASDGGPVNLIGVYSRANGSVKVALYTHDSTNDKPGSKIVSNDMDNTCTMNQWNYISIPETTLSDGTTYWIGYISSNTGATSYSSGSGRRAYKSQAYSGFSFPDQAGTGFTYSDSIGAVCAGNESTIAATSAVTGWGIETLYSISDVGLYTSLAFDSSDTPAISYYDLRHGDLKYAHWEGTDWEIETVDSSGDVGRYTSLAFDSSGNPSISYYDATYGDLKYAHWNGTGWEKETVDSLGDVGSYTSLAFDSTGNPGISYYDATNGDLKYAHWDGTGWDIETVDSAGNVGQYTSLAFDSSGNPAISYYDATYTALKYAYWNGASWDIEKVDSLYDVGLYTSLAFDSAGNPGISYHDATKGDLKYAHRNGASWEIETVDSAGWVGLYTSLAFSSSGHPAISYHDATNGDLKYACWNGESWDVETVDSAGWAGRYTSLAFDNSGGTAISYDEATHDDVKYAYFPNRAPDQPRNTSPANGAIDVSPTPTLKSSAFFDPDGDLHAASQWQVTTTPGDYSSPVFDSGTDSSNLTQVTIPSGYLSHYTTYYWRVRHQDEHGTWSSYSSETSFTTHSRPDQPSNVSPADGAVHVSLTPTLESSAFSDPDEEVTHAASQWQVTITSGDYSNPVFDSGEDITNLTQMAIPAGELSYDTTYYWRVRHEDSDGYWSSYSLETSFTTYTPPDQPVNISPADGATGVSTTFTLQSSAFSDPDEGAAHAASQWQVTTTAGDYSAPVYDSGRDSLHLTQITIASTNHNATYYWRVRHQNSYGAWSAWSAETSFTTAASSGLFSSALIWIFLVIIVLVAGAAIVGWWFLSKSSRKKPAQTAQTRPKPPYH
jgi:hypothetical protein